MTWLWSVAFDVDRSWVVDLIGLLSKIVRKGDSADHYSFILLASEFEACSCYEKLHFPGPEIDHDLTSLDFTGEDDMK